MGPLLAKDSEWVRQAFLVKMEDLSRVDQQNRIFTSASMKFVDTTPGGNFAINPIPQFTRYADLKPRNGSRRKGSLGLGRYYSEAFDDNQQLIHMRFGVPQFNSITTFFTGFYNGDAGRIARTGRAGGFFYYLGKAAGFVVGIMSWKLLAVTLLGYGARFFLNKPSSKFYYLKPTMPMYWNSVQTMVNQLAVNMGIVPRVWGDDYSRQMSDNYQFGDKNSIEAKKLNALLPEIFTERGSINVYAMANRAQRLDIAQRKALQTALDTDSLDLTKRIQEIYSQPINASKGANYESYLSKWFGSVQSQTNSAGDNGNGTSSTTEGVSKEPKDNVGFSDFLQAELDDGGAFATFRVNATGSVSESFSNQVGESEIAQKINSTASQSRSTSFNFANGNLIGGMAGQLLGSAFGAVKDFAAGALDSLELSGLAVLGGAAFVDIPQHWQSSTAQLAHSSYTINLVSPYGNPVSQLVNLYIPLCMLLAGALPLSTGSQSYSSPFILELYDKGRCQVRLGMIDSLSITRGTGNTGWTSDGKALGIEVSFSIVDLSSVIHMPVVEGFTSSGAQAGMNAGAQVGGLVGSAGGAAVGGTVAGPVGAVAGTVAGGTYGTAVGASTLGVGLAAVGGAVDVASNIKKSINTLFSDDTKFSDYMAVLASMGLADQIYQFAKFKRNLTRVMANWDTWASAASFASFMGDSLPGRMVSAIYKGTSR